MIVIVFESRKLCAEFLVYISIEVLKSELAVRYCLHLVEKLNVKA